MTVIDVKGNIKFEVITFTENLEASYIIFQVL